MSRVIFFVSKKKLQFAQGPGWLFGRSCTFGSARLEFCRRIFPPRQGQGDLDRWDVWCLGWMGLLTGDDPPSGGEGSKIHIYIYKVGPLFSLQKSIYPSKIGSKPSCFLTFFDLEMGHFVSMG